MNIKLLSFLITFSILTSCTSNKKEFDATGTFESTETIISAEATGIIKQLDITDGQNIKAGQFIGFIDSNQLFLKKKQLELQINALLSKKPNVPAQLAALEEQARALEFEKKRIENLLRSDAATPKQLDDIKVQITVVEKQIEAQRSSLGISNSSIGKEAIALQVQIEQVNDQLQKCRLVNPTEGTVLVKYVELNEMAVPGKPLYKLADLDNLILRAFVNGDQFSQIKLNQKVKVLVDNGPDKYKEYAGTIAWISGKAEFTPKTIQTKDERANLVYAIKIKVKNDGYLKLGMYGEVLFK